MVDKSYMLERKPRPSPLKQYFDQTVLPVAIDAAGGMEAALERIAVSVKQRPALTLGAALAVGAGLSTLLLQAMAGWRRRFRF